MHLNPEQHTQCKLLPTNDGLTYNISIYEHHVRHQTSAIPFGPENDDKAEIWIRINVQKLVEGRWRYRKDNEGKEGGEETVHLTVEIFMFSANQLVNHLPGMLDLLFISACSEWTAIPLGECWDKLYRKHQMAIRYSSLHSLTLKAVRQVRVQSSHCEHVVNPSPLPCTIATSYTHHCHRQTPFFYASRARYM